MTAPAPRAPGWTLWLPLALFAAFVAVVMAGLLRPAGTDIPSQMIGRALPQFALAPAIAATSPAMAALARPGLATADLADGHAHLLNIFASWCIPCVAEAPVIAELARRGAPIDGIAIRDHPADLATFLTRAGNPYARIGADDVSAVQLAIGSSGVPETFVIDGHGVIRYQHIGDIRADEIQPMLNRLAEAGR